eukprot:TRINITY_DN57573_c0_g1_i1.p1 TRINITY_DN57573_c0_g1~~TRINITY_DN57573_c0_g1_i1.p1  ORF type:complete len:298 (-),score=52.64 TRINITY_DN57573_c0_g1_i1:102-995(-)
MWKENGDEDGRKALLKDGGFEAPVGGMLKECVDEFERLHARATVRMQDLQNSSSTNFNEEARLLEGLLNEMESNRRQVQVQLRLELSGASGDAQQAWDRRLQEWSGVVMSFRKSFENLKANRARSSLQLSNGSDDTSALLNAARNSADRQSAMSCTDRLEESSRKLEEARRLALETESIGEGVLTDLHAQRSTVQNMRDNMRIVGSELHSARRSLDNLFRKAQQNRVVVTLLLFLLGIMLAFWGFTVLGLPFKWNVVLAIALVLLGTACSVWRRRRQQQREAREALNAPTGVWHSMF